MFKTVSLSNYFWSLKMAGIRFKKKCAWCKPGAPNTEAKSLMRSYIYFDSNIMLQTCFMNVNTTNPRLFQSSWSTLEKPFHAHNLNQVYKGFIIMSNFVTA